MLVDRTKYIPKGFYLSINFAGCLQNNGCSLLCSVFPLGLENVGHLFTLPLGPQMGANPLFQKLEAPLVLGNSLQRKIRLRGLFFSLTHAWMSDSPAVPWLYARRERIQSLHGSDPWQTCCEPSTCPCGETVWPWGCFLWSCDLSRGRCKVRTLEPWL